MDGVGRDNGQSVPMQAREPAVVAGYPSKDVEERHSRDFLELDGFKTSWLGRRRKGE